MAKSRPRGDYVQIGRTERSIHYHSDLFHPLLLLRRRALVSLLTGILGVQLGSNSHELGRIQPCKNPHRMQIDLELLAHVGRLADRSRHSPRTHSQLGVQPFLGLGGVCWDFVGVVYHIRADRCD